MNTTLYRSLALLISMFALTSSFSLSMEVTLGKDNDNVTDTSKPKMVRKTRKLSNTYEKEDPWILEMVDSKNSNSSILYNVTRQRNFKKKKKPSNFYIYKMNAPNIKSFVKTLGDNLDSTFVLYKLNSKRVTVGLISKDYLIQGYKLHLFWANKTNQVKLGEYALDKIKETFFAHKKMEVAKDGTLKLYFNGQGGKIIEVKTIKDKNGNITSSTNYLGINSSWGKNSKILFWGGIFIAIVVLVYVDLQVLMAPKKEISISQVGCPH